jgi:hypothetical protein
VLLRAQGAERTLRLVRDVLGHFPELAGARIRVGRTRTALGWASREGEAIWLRPRRLSRLTVAHELVHLLQARGLAPRGEKAADLFALARHRDLADDLPCYLRMPRALREAFPERCEDIGRVLHEAARDAAAARAAGERAYLRRFERGLAERWGRETRRLPPARSRLVQRLLFGRAVASSR